MKIMVAYAIWITTGFSSVVKHLREWIVEVWIYGSLLGFSRKRKALSKLTHSFFMFLDSSITYDSVQLFQLKYFTNSCYTNVCEGKIRGTKSEVTSLNIFKDNKKWAGDVSKRYVWHLTQNVWSVNSCYSKACEGEIRGTKREALFIATF